MADSLELIPDQAGDRVAENMRRIKEWSNTVNQTVDYRMTFLLMGA